MTTRQLLWITCAALYTAIAINSCTIAHAQQQHCWTTRIGNSTYTSCH